MVMMVRVTLVVRVMATGALSKRTGGEQRGNDSNHQLLHDWGLSGKNRQPTIGRLSWMNATARRALISGD